MCKLLTYFCHLPFMLTLCSHSQFCMCCEGSMVASQSSEPKDRSSPSAHASGAERARSGSPPPWANKVGRNAVFRPAIGSRDTARATPPPSSIPSPAHETASASHSVPASQDPAQETHRKPSVGLNTSAGKSLPKATHPAQQLPGKAPSASVSMRASPEPQTHRKPSPRLDSCARKSLPAVARSAQQVPNRAHSASLGARASPEHHSAPQQPPNRAPASSLSAPRKQQQAVPERMRARSLSNTPEPPAQAPGHGPGQAGQAGQPKSHLPRHIQAGKPPLRPGSGSSREAMPAAREPTPDTVQVSSSSGLSAPQTSRDKTPQPSASGLSLHGPTRLGGPGSASDKQGVLYRAACVLKPLSRSLPGPFRARKLLYYITQRCSSEHNQFKRISVRQRRLWKGGNAQLLQDA